MMADVGVSISDVPGPLWGPSLRMATMSHFSILPFLEKVSITSSKSNTLDMLPLDELSEGSRRCSYDFWGTVNLAQRFGRALSGFLDDYSVTARC